MHHRVGFRNSRLAHRGGRRTVFGRGERRPGGINAEKDENGGPKHPGVKHDRRGPEASSA